MELNFRSDNESPANPAIIEALLEANRGTAWAYAEDQWSERLDEAFSDLFGTSTTVVPVSTGTVANSIALASVTPPWGHWSIAIAMLTSLMMNAGLLNSLAMACGWFR